MATLLEDKRKPGLEEFIAVLQSAIEKSGKNFTNLSKQFAAKIDFQNTIQQPQSWPQVSQQQFYCP